MQTYGIFLMVVVAIGGVGWVFLYPLLSGERTAARRMASVARAEPVTQRPVRGAQKSRREQIEGTLKQLEARQKTAKRVPLSVRIARAGLKWSTRRFMVTAGGGGCRGVPGGDDGGHRLAGRVGFGVRGRRRAAILDIVVSRRSDANRASSRPFRMPSMSSFAASRPVCRCSTVSR